MLRIGRIVFPTDGSPSAAHAFPHALRLSTATNAELHVVYVAIPDLEGDEHHGQRTLLPSTVPGEVTLVERRLDGESAAQEIIQYCEDESIDLVVMGTRGRSGLGRLLLGSVAEKVVREAPCPVLTVPKRAPANVTARVLVAIDFSDYSAPTLQHAHAMAEVYGARLDVVHVLQEVLIPSAYGPDIGPVVTPQLEKRTQEALETLVRDVLGSEMKVGCQVSVGYPASEILRLADEEGIDLIVLSTHGLTGLQHFLIGSVAEKVVRKAPCPVLTVRSFGKSIAAE